MSRIRVLVVEDNFYTRLGTVAFLGGHPAIEVVGEAADGEQGLALFAALGPDVTVVDLRMPGIDGVELIGRIRAHAPEARVLVLTHYEGDEDISRALKAGARGYLTKETPGEDLVAAIQALHAGERVLPPALAARIARRETHRPLTPREQAVLELVARGGSNKDVACKLELSERTVEVYVSSILRKLEASSRTEAAVIARRRGIVRVEKG
jgi:DNA-binding NarL/FixJ family response regulator